MRPDQIGFIFTDYGKPISNEAVEILNAAVFLELAQKFRVNPGLKNEPMLAVFRSRKDNLAFKVEPRVHEPRMLWKELYAILPEISSWAIEFQLVEVKFTLWRASDPGFTLFIGRGHFRLQYYA